MDPSRFLHLKLSFTAPHRLCRRTASRFRRLDKNGVGHYETRTRVKKYYQQGADVNSGWDVFGGQGGNNPEVDLQKLSDFIAQVQKAGGR